MRRTQGIDWALDAIWTQCLLCAHPLAMQQHLKNHQRNPDRHDASITDCDLSHCSVRRLATDLSNHLQCVIVRRDGNRYLTADPVSPRQGPISNHVQSSTDPKSLGF